MGEVVEFPRALKMLSEATSIYIIEATGAGWIKVGISDNPHRRITDLRRATPHPLRLVHHTNPFPRADAYRLEQLIHAHLARKHARRGEWFECRPTAALRAMVSVGHSELETRRPTR